MAKLTIVVGLPGSGKSYYINYRKEKYPGICVEDFMAHSIEDSINFTHSSHYQELIKSLQSGKDCIIADITFCKTIRRIDFIKTIRKDVKDVVLEWIFFENDLLQCQANILYRGRPKANEEINSAQYLSLRYIIPEATVVIPVWRPEKHTD